MTESNEAIEVSDPTSPTTPWYKRKGVIFPIAAVAVFAIGGAILVNANAAAQRAEDDEASAAIAESVAAATAVREDCVSVAVNSTMSDNQDAYLEMITVVFGEESDEVVAANGIDMPAAHTEADCDNAASIALLDESEDPSDNLDAIIENNEAAVIAYQELADATKEADADAETRNASLAGLNIAYTDFSTARTSLTDAIAAAKKFAEGSLAKHLTDKQTKAVATTVADAEAVLEAGDTTDTLNSGDLDVAKGPLHDAAVSTNNDIADVTNKAENAKAKADEAARAAHAAAAQTPKSSSSSSGSKSSTGSSGKKSGSSSSGSDDNSSNIKTPAPNKKPKPDGVWRGAVCGGADSIWYTASDGWSYASAKADANSRGCKGFQ